MHQIRQMVGAVLFLMVEMVPNRVNLCISLVLCEEQYYWIILAPVTRALSLFLRKHPVRHNNNILSQLSDRP